MKKFFTVMLAMVMAAALAMPLSFGAASAADDAHCIYCGSSAYGDCGKSPAKKHKHAPNSSHSKCVWCGTSKMQASGSCNHGPGGKHEF